MIEPDRGRRLLRLWLRQAPPEARRFPNVFAERGLKSKDQMAVVWRRTSDPVRQRVVFPRSTNPRWATAWPEEVESEILEPLEKVLQGLPGVEELEGNANPGGAQVTLRFSIGTDMRNALVEVLGRINRLQPLPRDADRPVVTLGGDGTSNDTLSWFFVQLLPGASGSIGSHRRFIEDTVRPRLESIPGVASVTVNAGPPDNVRITVNPARAAALGVELPDIASRAASANNVSGGQIEVGRRQYALRFTGRFDPEQLGGLVLSWRDGRPVRLSDVATIEVSPPTRQFFAYQNGNPAFGIQVRRANGANVLSTLDAVKAAVAEWP